MIIILTMLLIFKGNEKREQAVEVENRGIRDYNSPMKNESTHTTPAEIAELAKNFQKSRVLLTAIELEIFTILGENKKGAEEIARVLNADPKGTYRLLCALVAMGFLEKEKESFKNTPTACQYLDQKSPDFMWMLKHTANKWDSWSSLTDAVRVGSSVSGEKKKRRGKKWSEAFIGAMHYRARHDADELVNALGFENTQSMLDVGGGSGVYAMAFCRRNPGMRASVLDLPGIVSITQGYIKEAGMEDCVRTIPGSYHTADFGNGYDLVLMSAIIHINSPEENIQLIARGAQGLNKGGRLVIRDFILNEDRVSPLQSVLFSLNMLTATQGGDTYTEKEMSDWMAKAGLGSIQRIDYANRQNLIVGVKI